MDQTPREQPPEANSSRAVVRPLVEISVGRFGWARLASEATRTATTVSEVVRRAAAHYECCLHFGLASTRVPRFAYDKPGSSQPVEVGLDGWMWHRLREEAECQSVSLERLLEHAALCYVANIDSGSPARSLRVVATPLAAPASP